MDIKRRLDREFSALPPSDGRIALCDTDPYLRIAASYASSEGALSVLSALRGSVSHVFYGRFSKRLGFKRVPADGEIPSIWEQEILDIIHPDDLEAKMVSELVFFRHVQKLPKSRQYDCCLHQKLRMLDSHGNYIDALHRLRYFPARHGHAIGFALCLYGPYIFPFNAKAAVADDVAGTFFDLDTSPRDNILSKQEIAVLRHIDAGRKSKDIAEVMSISINTISRHRQNILAKLRVRNSVEACRIARNLGLII